MPPRIPISDVLYDRLVEAALAEHRPPVWHAQYLLGQALGLIPEASGTVVPLRRTTNRQPGK